MSSQRAFMTSVVRSTGAGNNPGRKQSQTDSCGSLLQISGESLPSRMSALNA